MVNGRRSFLVTLLVLFAWLQPLSAYISKSASALLPGIDIYQSQSSRVSKLRTAQLQTAGRPQVGFIPRLEPGLRLLKSSTKHLLQSNTNMRFMHFPLNAYSEDEFEEEITETPEKQSEETNTAPKRLNLDGLFARVETSLKSFAYHFVTMMRKVVGTTMLFAAYINPDSIRRAALASTSAVALIASPKAIANAGVLKKYSKLSPMQKLATTPVYFMTNARGSALLSPDTTAGAPERRVVTYYLSFEDASKVLNEMSQISGPNDLRITTTTLEKVMEQIKNKKQSRKLGRYDMDTIFRIQVYSKIKIKNEIKCNNVCCIHTAISSTM